MLVSRFERVMERIEARLDRNDKLLDEETKFARRALDEIYRPSENTVPLKRRSEYLDEANEEQNKPELLYGEINLLDQGGATPVDQAHNIAKALWSAEERIKVCIDPKRALSQNFDREASDEERAKLYRQAVEMVFADNFSEKLYNKTLRLVNQRFCEKRVQPKVASA